MKHIEYYKLMKYNFRFWLKHGQQQEQVIWQEPQTYATYFCISSSPQCSYNLQVFGATIHDGGHGIMSLHDGADSLSLGHVLWCGYATQGWSVLLLQQRQTHIASDGTKNDILFILQQRQTHMASEVWCQDWSLQWLQVGILSHHQIQQGDLDCLIPEKSLNNSWHISLSIYLANELRCWNSNSSKNRTWVDSNMYTCVYIDGLVQNCSISNANAL